MGKIVYLMGKSSSGKDTIFKRLLADGTLDLKTVVPYTTRPIRSGERNGTEYFFTDEDGFLKLKAEGRIIEERTYQTFHGLWRYFTLDDGQFRWDGQDYIMIGTLEAYLKVKDYFGEDKLLPVMIELDDGVRLERALNRERKQAFPKYDDLNESVQENVSAIRVVKAYVREDYENKKFKKASENIYKIFCKAEGIVAWNAPVMNFTVYACIILISWLGAHMVVQEELTTGQLMSLLTYCMNILMNLMMLSMIFVMMTMSAASARRICEVLTEKPDLADPEEPVYEVKDGSIQFENVSFSYKKGAGDPVLKNINLDIKPGETIGIIGGTGSAKSSLVNLISRLYDVTEGQLLVGGVDVKDYDMEALRNQVAVVLQNNVLFSGTVLENLRWGDKDATEEECRHACQLACADEFIQKLPEGYETYIEQGGTNVSGGQKQRLCIARALLKKPKILILDDSTSAVDTATDAKIRRAFQEAIPGTTKLIIAQRISSVEHADRIIVMHDGQVHGFGTHEELLAGNEIYKEVYEAQMSGSGDFDE